MQAAGLRLVCAWKNGSARGELFCRFLLARGISPTGLLGLLAAQTAWFPFIALDMAGFAGDAAGPDLWPAGTFLLGRTYL